jgi:2-phosphosulfolactate phosphatase
MTFSQADFEIRCEWGEGGVAALAAISDVVIIVDVLSFSTCVAIAVQRGAMVFPYRGRHEGAADFAGSANAELAGRRGSGAPYSLSPASLLALPAGFRLVLPSPNGATLSLATGTTLTLAGCLRNYRAVARAAEQLGRRIAVIPAGERWPDGSLRPAIEDWLGAGAIVSELRGELSPEARAARAAFEAVALDLEGAIRRSGSGKELIATGYERDVALAAEANASDAVPVLVDGAYRRVEPGDAAAVS